MDSHDLDLMQHYKAEARLRVEWHLVQEVRFRPSDPGLFEDDPKVNEWRMMR